MKHDKYDLVVAGTGPASTFFLKKYLNKAKHNTKVLVLEKGFSHPHTDRVKDKKEDQDSNLNNKLDGIIEKGKKWAFSTGFGGSSNCWVGCTPRFMPSDFKMKTLYGIANDWPLTYDDLDPYYSEVEELMSVSGPSDTPFPKSSEYPLPAHQLSTVDKVLHKEYGNQYISQPTARASRPVKGRNACCSSGVCQVCPVNAKFTVENSNMGVYEDNRVELIFGTAVDSLDLLNDSVRAINFIKDGKEHQVVSEVFALGTNAIFNANILINSGDSNRFTGKGLGEQLGLQALVYLDGLANLGGSTYVTANGYMLYDGEHRKDFAACLLESSNSSKYVRFEKGKWRDLISFRMVFEDLAVDQNYVSSTQGSRMKPTANFKDISEYTKKGIENMKAKLPGLLKCLPIEKIEYRDPFDTESHILGTTRMSFNAQSGVVDKHLIHHQYRNLFVLGSGSFTTYTPSNPTLTLSALSMYAADKSF